MPSLRALVFLASVLAGLSLPSGWPSAARAQTLTWLLDPAVDAETRERIEGQTSDLPFTLSTTHASAPRADEAADALARAARLAAGSGARVVVWTTTRQTGLEVTIVDLEARRVLVREVAIDQEQERSAALESVGLIVRSALQVLAEGGEIGVVSPPAAPSLPAAEQTDHTAEDPELHADGQLVPESPPALSELMLGAGLGLRSLVDQGPAFEGAGALALRHAWLWVGLSVHASARQRVTAAAAAITVAHAGASLDLGVVAFERRALALVPLASLSLGRVRRETTRVSEGFFGTASRAHLDVRVGAGLLGRLALGDVAWLALHVRLELPLQRVQYRLNTGGEPATLARTPRVAPMVGLSVLARVGRPP